MHRILWVDLLGTLDTADDRNPARPYFYIYTTMIPRVLVYAATARTSVILGRVLGFWFEGFRAVKGFGVAQWCRLLQDHNGGPWGPFSAIWALFRSLAC